MKRSLPLLLIIVILISTPIAFAVDPGGVGSLRIDPPLPIKTATPAVFEIWHQSSIAYDPHIFLVIPESCFLALTGDTVVSWTGVSSPVTIEIGDWLGPYDDNSAGLPPTASPAYNVATLQSKFPTNDPVYYIFEPILEGPLTTTKETITVTLQSDDPEMLAYILGKQTVESEVFDTRVPPTIPGFVIPELPLGTLMGLASMLAALVLIIKKPMLSIRK
jgi:hypothetical protein